MENTNKDFLNSLDLIDKEMEKHIPYVLKDLWELGSIPEYIYQLIDKNIDKKEVKTIIDLGCGKGAVLIYLANKFDFKGIGVDIVPEFIKSAIQYSIENDVNKRLEFKADDIRNYIGNNKTYNIVIYGYDSGILGDVYQTISQLQNNISNSGFLILEIASTLNGKERIEGLPTEKELVEQLNKSDLKIIDKICWSTDTIRIINHENNKYINQRIEELKEMYPEHILIFDRYMSNQINECNLIENEMICSTWLLKKIPNGSS